MISQRKKLLATGVALFFFYGILNGQSEARPETSSGQKMYVPVYSHVYFGDSEREYNLSNTLLIRNVSQTDTIIVTQVDYYNSQGKLVRQYGDVPKLVAPLQSVWYIVRESDRAGGAGENFIIQWNSGSPVKPPMVETVNIGTAFGQGISFIRPGIVLEELVPSGSEKP